jgi:hypothetical protein
MVGVYAAGVSDGAVSVGPQMKLEPLDDASLECPLIRLYDFTPAEAQQLRSAVTELAAGNVRQVDVHRLPYVEPLGNCQLTFRLSSWDQCLSQEAERTYFSCALTADAWEEMADFIEPFTQDANGFQWRVGGPEGGGLLLSPSGEW